MTIFLGYITLFCLILMLAKFLARKSGSQKADHLFWKLHKPASGIFFIAVIMHLILGFLIIKAKSIMLIASGLLAFAIAIVLIALCHMMKDRDKKMFWHRLLSVVLFVVVFLHVIAYFAS